MIARSAPLIAVVLALAAVTSRDARANGRFPYANEIVVHPRDPSSFVVRTTFGLLTTTDRGARFHWVCEPIMGFTSGADPGVAMFDDGSIAVGSFLGAFVTHDGACSFGTIGGELAGQYVVDIALETKSPSRGVLLTATQQDAGATFVQVFATTDSARTWIKTGAPLDPALIPATIEVAPSRPERLYVSGAFIDGNVRRGFVITSDDRGATWRPRHVVDGVTSVYLAAVDPMDPDRAYARTYKAAGGDELLVTTDGFATSSKVLTVEGRLAGFALSPDGSKVAAGGPAAGTLVAARGGAFEKRSPIAVDCLSWTADALRACGVTLSGAPWVVGASTDDGRTYVPILGSLLDIAPPRACPAGSPSEQQCAPAWPAQRATFERLVAGASDAGAVDSGPSVSRAAPSASGAGCDCRFGRAPLPLGAVALSIAAVAGIVRRARSARLRGGR